MNSRYLNTQERHNELIGAISNVSIGGGSPDPTPRPRGSIVALRKRTEDANEFVELSSGRINSIDYSEDGKWLAAAYTTAPYLKLFYKNNDVWKLYKNLDYTPTRYGGTVRFSKDSKYLGITLDDSGVPCLLYERQGSEWSNIDTSNLPNGVSSSCCFSSDSSYFAITIDKTLYVCRIENSKLILCDTFVGRGTLSKLDGLDWSSDGKYLVVGDGTYTRCSICKFENESLIFIEQSPSLTNNTYTSMSTCKFSENGKYIGWAGGNSSTSRMGVLLFENEKMIICLPATQFPANVSPRVSSWTKPTDDTDNEYYLPSGSNISCYKREGSNFVIAFDKNIMDIPIINSCYSVIFSPDNKRIILNQSNGDLELEEYDVIWEEQ